MRVRALTGHGGVMADQRKTAAEIARALETSLGERIHSVLLFGSVARGEAVEGVSDINVLVLLDRVDAAALEATGPLERRWANAGYTVPLVMAEDEWRRAADVFAIELSAMKDAHVILHGHDPLVELEVDPAALRDRKSTRLNSSHVKISYAVSCLQKKKYKDRAWSVRD